jgi:phosphoserine phosphatase RsbU/P
MRILIAEDDSTSRFMLAKVLKNWAYEVVSTVNGLEAWQELKKEDAPKLVLLDWMMPEMDGVEVCKNVRSLSDPNPPYIILLTALGKKTDIIEGLDAGANDYVCKPFDNEELKARLNVGRRYVELQQKLVDRINELEEAAKHIQTLQGILPICMHCHKIRSDSDAWEKIDDYLEKNTNAEISHGLCEECLEKYYPEDEDDSE